jgi:F0F1-type ATP synthase epsilon subunit
MLNPPITPIDLSGGYADVSALLTILADPAAHKARLDELIAQETAAKEQIAALNDMAADTRRLHSAAEATK